MLTAILLTLTIPTLALYACISVYAAWDQREAGFQDWWSAAVNALVFTAATIALAGYAWSLMWPAS